MRSIPFAAGLALAALVSFGAAAEPGSSGASAMKAKMDAAKHDAGNDLRAKPDLRADASKAKSDAILKLADIRGAAESMDAAVKSDVRTVTGAAKTKGAIGPAAIKTAKAQSFARADIANAAASSQYRLDHADKAAKQANPASKLR
jgi:hypothetical protein